MAGERFSREAGKPRLAEAPPADSAVDTEVEASELLKRLEQHAAESGRLEGQAQKLERALEQERDGRRRLAATLKRERRAAKALHDRAEHDRAARAAAEDDLERVRQAFKACRAAAAGRPGRGSCRPSRSWPRGRARCGDSSFASRRATSRARGSSGCR